MKKNPFSLKDKHILISGASSGIGRQCAISCSQMGARVTLVARNIERLNSTLDQLEGDNHFVISSDISNIKIISDVVARSVTKLGKINGFVHAAGLEYTLPIKMHTNDIISEIMDVNFYAAIEFIRQVSLKKNHEKNNLSLVLISSIMGVVGNKGLTGYSASKGALLSAIKSMSLELASREVRVNAISPGHISGSNMSIEEKQNISNEAILKIKDSYPLGLGSSEDVAYAAIYLLSDASKWVTGTNLIIDGGYCAR